MIVVDTSTLIDLYLGAGHSARSARRILGTDTAWYAPVHQHVEFLQSLRGLLLGRKITPDQAEAARKLYGCQAIAAVAVEGAVADRVWELRHNITSYDAAYVAVAETLNCALVTGDARLATAPGVHCEIRLIR
ncbi:type II toxin-antitoxin system VapC family toxin [Allosalinactinospora lopnorensis]|uniref:type II toxin-antitoxin system VapC family toxin n=1 Tax=Allosalinactinospora lopnorensis TaxID=1352348 RepID=UPI000623D953|nr:type II toxin-antitoxin system VapC family toxin [Allosalinactinospora lopnorensis]